MRQEDFAKPPWKHYTCPGRLEMVPRRTGRVMRTADWIDGCAELHHCETNITAGEYSDGTMEFFGPKMEVNELSISDADSI